jgi:drug/metabolite transporter (DMT)-like permease
MPGGATAETIDYAPPRYARPPCPPGVIALNPQPTLPAPATAPAIAALLVNAFVWGVSWWPFRWLADRGLHPLWATAAIYLAALALIALRHPGALTLAWRRPALLALGAAAGVTNTCFNWGVSIGEVVRVVLLFYLMPIWAVLLARALLGEPLRAAALGPVLMAVSGAALVLWQPGLGVPMPASTGDWLGLAGGMGFALTNVLLRRQASDDAWARAAAMFAGGTLMPGAVALACLALGVAVPLPALAPGAFGPLLLIAVIFVVANLALQYGAARLPTRVTAVVMLSEVLFAAVSSVGIAGEPVTMRLIAGAALIVGASLVSAWRVR